MKLAFYFRKYHKWLALIVGIQALIWAISGFYMTTIHIDYIHGDHLVKKQQSIDLSTFDIKPLNKEFLASSGEIKRIQLKMVQQQPVYFIKTDKESYKINALTLQQLPQLDEASIIKIASQIYAGENKVIGVELLEQYPKELGATKQPIWQVQYDDWLESTLYFLPDSGQLRSKRSNLWRIFDFFWMLHIMDYDTRDDINNNLLRVAASVGFILTLTGLGLLFHSFRNQANSGSSIISALKKVHKWIALFIGLQLMLWMLSGLMFSLLSPKEVSGRYLINQLDPVNWKGRFDDFSNLLKRYPEATTIDSSHLLGKNVYRVSTDKKRFIVEGQNFNIIDVDENMARELTRQYFAVAGEMVKLDLETEVTTENRRFTLPLWRADFDDEQNSSLYFSAATGSVFGVKTDTWRLFDIFWMLHIMDYSERNDFNNSLVIFAALFNSFIAISGIWLLFLVFSKRDFNFRARFQRVPLLLNTSNGNSTEVFVTKNSRLIDALAKEGYQLPSTCGGGGSCGLCKVQVDPSLPVSEADSLQLSDEERNSGCRLACQLSLTQGVKVVLPEQVIQQQLLSCRVVSNEFKTPFIKELILEIPPETDFQFSAGEYVLFHIPAGESHLGNVELDKKVKPYWEKLNINLLSSLRTEPVSRSYSMANPPSNNKNIVLNIRLALPENEKGETGKASSYLFNLKKRDSLNVSGPFGHFHAAENENEMIFIGGGAGMAPLRSHILHQLETLGNKNKISFWYGARNQSEIFYADEFERLMEENDNFSWHVALSDKDIDESWKGDIGYIHQVLDESYLKNITNIHAVDFYICGPPLMNQATKELLSSYGVKENNIHIDDFGS